MASIRGSDPPWKVTEVIPEFADAFGFEQFNRMQCEALPGILDTDANVVASAPTASGKTALAELAICRTLQAGGTALFIAPMRALTNEKESEWDRFEQLGYSVYVVTGERDLNPRRAGRADILVMTPEKADSATRKHESARYSFVTDVDSVLIDEVHLLDSDRRGGVLEVVVSRLRRLCGPRIVALSATMKNVDDVAEWLDAPPETTFDFGDNHRPVKLETGVKTYSHGENSFADKYRRLYRALDLAEPHIRDDGQALVFVSSRQDTVHAAKKTRDELAERDVPMGARGDYELHTAAESLTNDELRRSVPDGVGFHHAGLAKDDRDQVEEWFRQGKIELLFSTSTLAWGVNLPARCVVIRDTKYHDPLEGETDISPLDVLQMLGRAGRPEYDDIGYGRVVCDRSDADRYRRLLREGKAIESRLPENLPAHLNAEIAMGTLQDIDDVMEWLETTFYNVRARSEPDQYRFESTDGVQQGLRSQVQRVLESLIEDGFVATDDLGVEPTQLGRLASKYYLRLETAGRFSALASTDTLDVDTLLEAVAGAAEFDSVSARSAEADAVDRVLRGHETTLDGGHRKVLAILLAATDGTTPPDLRSDAWVIKQNALRLLAALGEFLEQFAGFRAANLASRVESRVEHGVARAAVPLTAIDGVGDARAERLAGAGFKSPAAVASATPSQLTAAGIGDGVADRITSAAAELPRIGVEWGPFPETIGRRDNTVRKVTVVNRGGGARAGIRVTVNGVEMNQKTLYLDGETTVPVGVFGSPEAQSLEYVIEVVFPNLQIMPSRDSRTVTVDGS
ncbi:MAG: superfamily II helicase [uncultured archaeon A07HR60]|nr:MAG: superfamily II helicase [uncultured archaeon A07HR60]